jgi:hypothetical protein
MVPDGDTSMRLAPLTSLARIAIILLAVATAASAQPPPEILANLHYKAVLIAGDRSSPAFDHATETMRAMLVARQVAPADIQRLSAARMPAFRGEVRSSTLAHVLSAIEQLHPAPGQGCFVFATSHGGYDEGLVLVPSENFLTPVALDAALTAGCGDAPTVVIVSGCFSGGFATPPMARANRVILTAARQDRPSFGCGAGFQYTFYDRCLLQAMSEAPTWLAAYATIRSCVATREQAMHVPPSGPRAWFGEAVRDMPIPRAP